MRQCGEVLLIGVTLAEMKACMDFGSEGVLMKLKRQGVFPYTTLTRKSVV